MVAEVTACSLQKRIHSYTTKVVEHIPRSAGSQSLSWGLLEGAIVGMYNALSLRGKHRTLSFTLWDARTGMVGLGNLSAEKSP